MRLAYLGIVVLITATAVWGFWSTYWGPVLAGGVPHFWFIHLHAAVFLGWILLLLAQALLVAGGNPARHKQIGLAGMYYGAFVFGVGLFISVAGSVARVHSGELATDIAGLVALYNLTDVMIYGAFFLLAMCFRSQSSLHRRLIICAAIALTGAAVGRVMPTGSWSYLAVWLAPLMLGVAFDLVSERRVHPVFLAGAVAFALMFFKMPLFAMMPFARGVGRGLIATFV